VADPEGSIDKARAAGYRGSDQAWISYCLTNTECHWPEPSGIYCAQDHRGVSRRGPGRFRIRPVVRRRSGRTYTVQTKVFDPGPVHVPEGAVILHLNGAIKAWDMKGDEIVETFWRPFSDEAVA